MASASRHTTVVIGVVAASLLAITATLAYRCHTLDQKYKGWISHHPCEARVDLSRPGTSRAAFEQTCDVAHGEHLFMKVRPAGEPESAEGLTQLIAGLKGHMVIRDRRGREVVRQPLGGDKVTQGYDEGEVTLCYLDNFQTGKYTIEVEVERGAPALAGREQVVFARYMLCGSEFLPGTLAGLGSMVAGLPGVVLGLLFVFRMLREGSRGKPEGEPAG